MEKKIVLITGTNSGFGWLATKSLADSGHTVYATIRDTKGKNADKTRELEQIENVTVLDVSLTDEESVKNAVDTVINNEGRIDVLVNNAGAGMFGVAESATVEDLQRMLEVNAVAPWRLMKLTLPYMRKQSDGLIINISSGWGRFSAPFSAIYAASKFALEALSEGLHYEVRHLGVDVAIIQPGAFPTEMSQKVQFGSDASVSDEYKTLAELPNKMGAAIGKMFEATDPNPQEVADAIVNLVNSPKGHRPLRTNVDRATGHMVEAANRAVEGEYANVLTAFGLGELIERS